MTDMEESRDYLVLHPDGAIVLPPGLMEKYVMTTAGCRLWYNQKVAAVSIRLSRDEVEAPYLIEREADEGGERGVIRAGVFFNKVGCDLGVETRTIPCQYYSKYQAIEFRIAAPADRPDTGRNGFWDDFPAIDD